MLPEWSIPSKRTARNRNRFKPSVHLFAAIAAIKFASKRMGRESKNYMSYHIPIATKYWTTRFESEPESMVQKTALDFHWVLLTNAFEERKWWHTQNNVISLCTRRTEVTEVLPRCSFSTKKPTQMNRMNASKCSLSSCWRKCKPLWGQPGQRRSLPATSWNERPGIPRNRENVYSPVYPV